MFMGSYDHKIDGKGRLVMPAKFRSQIGDTVICTVGLDNCVAVYPVDSWNQYLQKLQSLPFTKGQARQFMRTLLGAAEELPVDGQGRILLSARLRKYADLQSDVVVNGVNDHLEIWNGEKWNVSNDEMLEKFTSLAEGVSDLGI
jgi:MraZ protein